MGWNGIAGRGCLPVPKRENPLVTSITRSVEGNLVNLFDYFCPPNAWNGVQFMEIRSEIWKKQVFQ